MIFKKAFLKPVTSVQVWNETTPWGRGAVTRICSVPDSLPTVDQLVISKCV